MANKEFSPILMSVGERRAGEKENR